MIWFEMMLLNTLLNVPFLFPFVYLINLKISSPQINKFKHCTREKVVYFTKTDISILFCVFFRWKNCTRKVAVNQSVLWENFRNQMSDEMKFIFLLKLNLPQSPKRIAFAVDWDDVFHRPALLLYLNSFFKFAQGLVYIAFVAFVSLQRLSGVENHQISITKMFILY